MNKKLFYWIAILALVFAVFFLLKKKQDTVKEEQANILLEKIQNVEKLIVVEGTFAEVYTHKQSSKIFFDLYPVEKKVIVIVKAKASVGYDLTKVDYEIDKDHKKIIIHKIPEEEIIIEPDIQYYDIDDSQFYRLNEKDFTEVNKRAKELILNQVKASVLPMQAKERLQVVLENIILEGKKIDWEVVID